MMAAPRRRLLWCWKIQRWKKMERWWMQHYPLPEKEPAWRMYWRPAPARCRRGSVLCGYQGPKRHRTGCRLRRPPPSCRHRTALCAGRPRRVREYPLSGGKHCRKRLRNQSVPAPVRIILYRSPEVCVWLLGT